MDIYPPEHFAEGDFLRVGRHDSADPHTPRATILAVNNPKTADMFRKHPVKTAYRSLSAQAA
jgi:hypothetical protein